jgi:hypothetical protein
MRHILEKGKRLRECGREREREKYRERQQMKGKKNISVISPASKNNTNASQNKRQGKKC